MLHEPFFKAKPVSPRWGLTTPAPLLFLDSGHELQPRCLLSLLTPKCFVSPAQPRREGQSLFSCFFAVWAAPGGRVSTELAWWPRGASSTGFKSGFWCPLIPSPPNQTNAVLSDLLWPLRHVLFLTPSWNWLSSSKNQVPVPRCPPT